MSPLELFDEIISFEVCKLEVIFIMYTYMFLLPDAKYST